MERQAYSLEGAAQQLLGDLDLAQAQDKIAERQKDRWRQLGCLGIAVAFLSIFGLALSNAALAVTVAGVVVGVAGFVVAGRRGRFDVDDRKLGSARRLIRVLQADIPASWPIGLTLDLRPYDKAGPPVEEDKAARRRRWEQTWLELRANLADGCSVVALLRDEVSRKEKPKRKRTKVAERFATEATVKLHLARQYGDAEALVSRLQAAPQGHEWTVVSCRGRGRALWLTVAPPTGLRVSNRSTTVRGMDKLADGDTLLQALHWVYGEIAASRRAA
jgi:hypothetical protein